MLMVPSSKVSVPLTVVMRTWVNVPDRDLLEVEVEYKELVERDVIQVATQVLEVFNNTIDIIPVNDDAAPTELAANIPDVLNTDVFIDWEFSVV